MIQIHHAISFEIFIALRRMRAHINGRVLTDKLTHTVERFTRRGKVVEYNGKLVLIQRLVNIGDVGLEQIKQTVVFRDDKAVTVGALEECIRRGAKSLLKDVALFDIYTGTGIPEGKKSVAFNLTLRADDRSLTAEEADADVKSILELLAAELNAVLR